MATIMVDGVEVEETAEETREREDNRRPTRPDRPDDGNPRPERLAPLSAFQLRAQLATMTGGGRTMLDHVEAVMARLMPDAEIALAWRWAAEVPRDSKLAQAVADALGWAPGQLDAMWREGAARKV